MKDVGTQINQKNGAREGSQSEIGCGPGTNQKDKSHSHS